MEIGLETSSRRLTHTRGHGLEAIVTTSEKKKLGWVSNRSLHLSFTVVCFLWLLNFATAHVSATSTIRPWPSHEFFANVINKTVGREMVNETEYRLPLKSLKPDTLETVLKFKETGATRIQTANKNVSIDVDNETLRSNATAKPPGSATIAVRLLSPEASLASTTASATLSSRNPNFIKQTGDNSRITKPPLGGATIIGTELQAREDTAEKSPTFQGKFSPANISLGNKDSLTSLNFPTVDGASNVTYKPVALTKPETREQLQRDQPDTRVNYRTGQAREWVPLLPKATLSNSHQSRHEAYPSQVSTGETVPFRVFRSKKHQAKFPPGLGLYTSLDLNRNENFETSTKEYVDDDKFGWWGPEEEVEGSNSFPTRPPDLMRLTWPYTKTWTGTKRPTTGKTEHPIFVGSNPVKATLTSRPATQYPVIVPQRLTSSNPITSTPPTTFVTGDQDTRFYKVPIIIVTPTPRPNYVTIVSSNKISSHHWGSHGASTGTWLIPGSGGQLQAPLPGAVSTEESKFSTKMMELVTNPPKKYSQLPASKNTGTAIEFAVEDKNERGGEAPELMGFKNPTNIWYKPVINHHYGSREDGSSVKKNEKFNNTVITLANTLPQDMTLLPFQQHQSQASHSIPEPPTAPSTSLLGNIPGSESGYFGSENFNENSSSSHHHSHSSTVLLGSSATKQGGEKILFRVWNLVNGSLELDSETGIPRWLLKYVDINKDHVLNLNELPRPIQSLVEENSFLSSKSPPLAKTSGNGSESTLLEKRLGFQGQWEPLASKKNILLGSFKSPDSQSPSPNHPVLNYVLWPPGKSLLQDPKFHHQRPSETSLFDHLFSEETESGNWNRIRDYLKRQQFANSYPAYLPLEPNPGQFPQFHDKDVSNLLALSLILSYLNRNGVDGEAKPGYLTSMFPTPPHKQSHYSSSPDSALHSIHHTLNQLLPEQPTRFGNHQENFASPSFTSSSQYSSNSHHQQQPPRPNPSRSPSPPPSPNPMDSFSKTPTPPAYQDYQDEEEDNKNDNRFGETNNFPVSIKDRTKTLLTKFIKKKFKKKLKKKLKKKKGLSAFDFNFDIGIDLVDLVKNKLLTLLTLKYAPLAVLALTTLAPTVLIYIPLLLKVFHKFKHHDDDDHHPNPPVHHFVYPYTYSYPVHPPSHDGPPPKGHDQGWGWGDHSGYSGVGPRQHHHHRGHHSPSFTHSAPSQTHAPPGPSGSGVENVPGPPYYPPGTHGHPSPDPEEVGGKGPPTFVRGHHKHMHGPAPPPTGPFQFTENDADGYMTKIRDIGRNLGKIIGNQISDPVNQQAMQIIVDSKKDAFSSLLSKLLDFKPMDYRPKFKDSDEEWPQNGRRHSFRKRRKRMLYKY